MTLPQVIVLNGTSSSGKTAIAHALQELLPEQYLNFSIDSVLYTLPAADLVRMQKGDVITRNGYDWQALVRGYHYCLPGLLQAGLKLIVDNAWCDLGEKRELLTELAGYQVALVGVQCQLEEVIRREKERGDRAIGLASWEFQRVHQHMDYDLTLDTTTATAHDCAAVLINQLTAADNNWAGARTTLDTLSMLSS